MSTGALINLCQGMGSLAWASFPDTQASGFIPDASGNGRPATVFPGTVAYNQAVGNLRGLLLTGNGSGADASTHCTSVTDNFTMAFYGYSQSGNSTYCYVGNSGLNGWGMYYNSPALSALAGNVAIVNFSGSPVPSTTTPQLLIISRSAGVWSCYIDNVSQGTSGAGAPGAPSGTTRLAKAEAAGSTGVYAAFAAIWTKVLSASERTSLYDEIKRVGSVGG